MIFDGGVLSLIENIAKPYIEWPLGSGIETSAAAPKFNQVFYPHDPDPQFLPFP